jgi:hypothetical protein
MYRPFDCVAYGGRITHIPLATPFAKRGEQLHELCKSAILLDGKWGGNVYACLKKVPLRLVGSCAEEEFFFRL